MSAHAFHSHSRHVVHRCDAVAAPLCRGEHSTALTAAVTRACSASTHRKSNQHSGDALIGAAAPLTTSTALTLCISCAKWLSRSRVFAIRSRRRIGYDEHASLRHATDASRFKPPHRLELLHHSSQLRSSAGLIGSCRIARHCCRKTIPSPPSARICNETHQRKDA